MVILRIFCLIIFSINLDYISCEDRLAELEKTFSRRFEKLENENIVLKELLQNLKSRLEQYERFGMEYLFDSQLKGAAEKTVTYSDNYGKDGKEHDIESASDVGPNTTSEVKENSDGIRLVHQSDISLPITHSNNAEDESTIKGAKNRIYADKNNKYNKHDLDTGSNSGIRSDASRIMTGTLQLRRQTSENVAFHAYISGGRCYGSHETFVFDVAVSNYGNGYNTHDGIFDAPVTGVYVLTLTVLPGLDRWVRAEIVINGSVVGKTVGDSDHSKDYHPGTAIVVIHINAGDHVFVRRASGADCDVIGDGYARTSFSGWLLF